MESKKLTPTELMRKCEAIAEDILMEKSLFYKTIEEQNKAINTEINAHLVKIEELLEEMLKEYDVFFEMRIDGLFVTDVADPNRIYFAVCPDIVKGYNEITKEHGFRYENKRENPLIPKLEAYYITINDIVLNTQDLGTLEESPVFKDIIVEELNNGLSKIKHV